MSQVWAIEGMKTHRKMVLLAIADNANDEGVAWPSLATLALKCGMTERAVRMQIRELENAGFLRSEMRSGTSTIYAISIPGTPEPGSPGTTFPPERGSPLPRNEVPVTPERGSPKPSRTTKGTTTGAGGAPTEQQVIQFGKSECIPADCCKEFHAYWSAEGWVSKSGQGQDLRVQDRWKHKLKARWYNEQRNGGNNNGSGKKILGSAI